MRSADTQKPPKARRLQIGESRAFEDLMLKRKLSQKTQAMKPVSKTQTPKIPERKVLP